MFLKKTLLFISAITVLIGTAQAQSLGSFSDNTRNSFNFQNGVGIESYKDDTSNKISADDWDGIITYLKRLPFFRPCTNGQLQWSQNGEWKCNTPGTTDYNCTEDQTFKWDTTKNDWVCTDIQDIQDSDWTFDDPNDPEYLFQKDKKVGIGTNTPTNELTVHNTHTTKTEPHNITLRNTSRTSNDLQVGTTSLGINNTSHADPHSSFLWSTNSTLTINDKNTPILSFDSDGITHTALGSCTFLYTNSAGDLECQKPCADGQTLSWNEAETTWKCLDIPTGGYREDCLDGEYLLWDNSAHEWICGGYTPIKECSETAPYLFWDTSKTPATWECFEGTDLPKSPWHTNADGIHYPLKKTDGTFEDKSVLIDTTPTNTHGEWVGIGQTSYQNDASLTTDPSTAQIKISDGNALKGSILTSLDFWGTATWLPLSFFVGSETLDDGDFFITGQEESSDLHMNPNGTLLIDEKTTSSFSSTNQPKLVVNANNPQPLASFGDTTTQATGMYSFAVGQGAAASAESAFAFGKNNTASGAKSFVLGGTNSSANGINSFSVGSENTVSGKKSFGLGNFLTPQGEQSFTFGTDASTGTDATQAFSFGFGWLGDTSDTTTSAIPTKALASNAFALGSNATQIDTTSANSFALGSNVKINNSTNAFGIGREVKINNANKGFALGNFTETSAENAFALGHGKFWTHKASGATNGANTTASAENSFALGYQAQASGKNSFALGNNITNGTENTIMLSTKGSKDIVVGEISGNNIVSINGDISSQTDRDLVSTKNLRLSVNGDVQVRDLTPSSIKGSDFLCIDDDGLLYKSTTPCQATTNTETGYVCSVKKCQEEDGTVKEFEQCTEPYTIIYKEEIRTTACTQSPKPWLCFQYSMLCGDPFSWNGATDCSATTINNTKAPLINLGAYNTIEIVNQNTCTNGKVQIGEKFLSSLSFKEIDMTNTQENISCFNTTQ